jgi:hypothetical protein
VCVEAAACLGPRWLKVVDAVSALAAAGLADGLVGALDLPGTAKGTRAPEAKLGGHCVFVCVVSDV